LDLPAGVRSDIVAPFAISSAVKGGLVVGVVVVAGACVLGGVLHVSFAEASSAV